MLSSPESSHAAGTYYVDRSSPCSDLGPGTEALPYCTITGATVARGGPGTTILVKPGVYPEQVSIGVSGALESPFELRALPGGVVVDGADDFSDPGRWTQFAGDVWRAEAVTWCPRQVFADGDRLAESSAAPSDLPSGTFRWVLGAGLYVNAGGGSPAGHQTRVGRRSHGFVASDRIALVIDGFVVRHTEDNGIHLPGACENVTVANNRVEFAYRMGIQAMGGFGLLLQSNTVSDSRDHGIALTARASGAVLEDNESFRNGISSRLPASGIHLAGSPGIRLRRNRVYDNQDSGIHFQGGANNCVSTLNLSWSNGDRGYDHIAASGTVHVCDVAWGNGRDGFSVQSRSTGTRIHNSIASDNGISSGGFDLSVDAGSRNGFASNDNVLWNSAGQALVKYDGVVHATVASYSAASGQDTRSIEADPLFENPLWGEFRPGPGSPAIDNANTAVSHWPAADAAGRARRDDPATANSGLGPQAFGDRGALEYLPPDSAPLVLAPATAFVAEGNALSIFVRTIDGDGDPIQWLGADLSALPGSAHFVADPADSTGILTWTPGFGDSGTYAVTFTALNALTGSAATDITVGNVDRAPVVTAPDSVWNVDANGEPIAFVTIAVEAWDADGDAIASLGANLADLPAGNDAVFTPDPERTSGTLTWSPGMADTGSYTVVFTAGNALWDSTVTTIMVRPVPPPRLPGVYYVDVSSPACSDGGPGSDARPFCTIGAALDRQGGPGTTLIVRPGIYRERVEIGVSGNPDSLLILRAAGNGVVIDGADDLANPARWSPHAGSVWVASGVDWGPQQVFVEGARLTPSGSAPDSLTPGSFRWVEMEGLYVNLGGSNPGDHAIMVGRRSYGFVAYGRQSVVIEGFTVTRADDRGIHLSEGCANIRVLGNAVTFAAGDGIQVTSGHGFVIGGNRVSDNGDHGISLTTGVSGSVIEDNESFRNARPLVRAANGIYLHGSSGNTIRRNRLHHNQDSGLHFQSGANDNVAYLNCSWSNGDHGYDHLGASGTVHVGDVAHGNYRDGFSIEGGSPGTRIHNSIAIDNGLATGHFDLWVDAASSPGFESDYNLFWNSTSQPPVKYVSTLYSTVPAYSAASGQDANSLQADPRFENPAAGDFHLKAGSIVIDNADSGVLHWPEADAEGRARVDDPARPDQGAGPVAFGDRGAHEYLPPEVADVGTGVEGTDSNAAQLVPRGSGLRGLMPEPSRPQFTPNPMRARGVIELTTSRMGSLVVEVFDSTGRRVRRLAQAEVPGGRHELVMDGRGDDGSALSAGMYFYRVASVDGPASGRFVLLR